MRVPTAWLREFVAVPEDNNALADFNDALTMAGLEVEEVLATPTGPTLYTKITPNRGDWSSVYGTAREAAAVLDTPLKPLPTTATQPVKATRATGKNVSITIEEPEQCPRFSATIIKNVKVGPTPQWMQDRLFAALGDGYRHINNIADITNYVMLELGQPLHAFDLATIPNGEIVVREAKQGETLVTLDEVKRELAPGMLCICDNEKPISIAGIMGGQPTEITDTTTDVLLEAAHFEQYGIRRTAKKTLASQASYRFERYVDPNLVPLAAARAAQLMVEYAGGEIVEVLDVYPKPPAPVRVLARMERVRRLLGADVDRDQAITALERLGISVERSAGAMDCVIPPWRPDITIEDDIAEEVGRIALGYGNLPENSPPVLNPKGGDSPKGVFSARVKNALVRAGFQEVQTHSLIGPNALKGVAESDSNPIPLRSPRAPEYSLLRDSLLPNLAAIIARAARDGIRDVAIFEVGPVYQKAAGDSYEEPIRVSGLCTGFALPSAWSLNAAEYRIDFYFVKGVVEQLLSSLGIHGAEIAAGTHPLGHPGRTATISLNGKKLGVIAELSETVSKANDLPYSENPNNPRTYLFDLDGDLMMSTLR